MNLLGKNIILTGAGRGIGRAIALEIARQGGALALISRSEQELQETLNLIHVVSPASFFIVADMSKRESVHNAFLFIKKRLDIIDVLINNAGIQGPIGLFHENNLDDWEMNLRTNLLGPVVLTHAVLPLMMAQKMGKIINMSGGGATGTRPNFSAYAVAKTAIVRFTENLADEYREFNIDINAVAPGAVNTKMLAEVICSDKKAGKELAEAIKRQSAGGTDPEIPARLISFLASDASNGITGKLISAPWDPWQTEEYCQNLRNDRNLGTLRRIDNKYFIEKS